MTNRARGVRALPSVRTTLPVARISGPATLIGFTVSRAVREMKSKPPAAKVLDAIVATPASPMGHAAPAASAAEGAPTTMDRATRGATPFGSLLRRLSTNSEKLPPAADTAPPWADSRPSKRIPSVVATCMEPPREATGSVSNKPSSRWISKRSDAPLADHVAPVCTATKPRAASTTMEPPSRTEPTRRPSCRVASTVRPSTFTEEPVKNQRP